MASVNNNQDIPIADTVRALLMQHSALFKKWNKNANGNHASTLNAKGILAPLEGIQKEILSDILAGRPVAYWDGRVEDQRLSVGVPGGKVIKRPHFPDIPPEVKQAIFDVLEYLQFDSDSVFLQAILLDNPAIKPAPVLRGPFLLYFRETLELLTTTLNIEKDPVEFDTTDILAPLDLIQREAVRRIFARESLGDWRGQVGQRRVHTGRQVMRPLLFVPEPDAKIVDSALEFLMASREPTIQGQLVDCFAPPGLAPNVAQTWRQLSPVFQDDDAFDAAGGIPSMQDFYEYFWSQPWATIIHFNCLVRMLLFKNVGTTGPEGLVYQMGFSQEVVQQVIDFMQIPPEYSSIVIDAYGQGYTHEIRTEADKAAILRRLPRLAPLLDSFTTFPIRLDITTVNFPPRHFKALMMLIKGEDLARQKPEVRLQTQRNGRRLQPHNWYHTARPLVREGKLWLNYYTPYGQENINALEHMFGIPRNNTNTYWSYFNPSWRRNAQNALRQANINLRRSRQTRRGYGRRAMRGNNNNNRNYNDWANREYNWYGNQYNSEPESEPERNYNATKGRRLTRQELERLNRDPFETNNNEGGGRKKTRRNRK